MALKGTMLLNGADYAPLTCTALACLWRIPGREFTETTDFVVQLKGRVQFLRVNTGLLTEGLEVSFRFKSEGSGSVE